MARPQRWDEPFGPDMTDEDVARLMERPEIASIEADKFPGHTPLEGILKNDTRIVRVQPGDLVVREGDYGNSAFLVMSGKLRVVLAPGLPGSLLGRQPVHRKGFFEALSQLWRNRAHAEARPTNRRGRYDSGLRRGPDAAHTHIYLQDTPSVLDEYRTATLGDGALFGELAALGRVPRTATIFAETEAELLEIRWQGLRELRRYDIGWRRLIDERYRRNALTVHLTENPLFKGLDEESLQQVASRTLFETYGSFDWHVSYKQMRKRGESDISKEPWIVREGDYPDGLLMIRAGFARVSVKTGRGHRTLTYLGAGDHFGLPELYALWKGEETVMRASLTALGYVDVLRVPAPVLEEHVFPKVQSVEDPIALGVDTTMAEVALIEWATDERFINGRQAMLIDLDRCVRCDDCVRACASTHDGNPRFVRQGKTFDHWMVANACMHCADPVCMIGCPTGAIHRTPQGGMVVINDVTCIGCATCANSCPYGNIRMVEIADEKGNLLLDPDKQMPILKATKCDLCSTQPGGPACARACPHDALRRVDFQPEDLFEETLG